MYGIVFSPRSTRNSSDDNEQAEDVGKYWPVCRRWSLSLHLLLLAANMLSPFPCYCHSHRCCHRALQTPQCSPRPTRNQIINTSITGTNTDTPPGHLDGQWSYHRTLRGGRNKSQSKREEVYL